MNKENSLDKKIKNLSKRLKVLLAGAGLFILADGCSYSISYGVGLPYPDCDTPSFVIPGYEPRPFIFIPPGYCSIHNRYGCCR